MSARAWRHHRRGKAGTLVCNVTVSLFIDNLVDAVSCFWLSLACLLLPVAHVDFIMQAASRALSPRFTQWCTHYLQCRCQLGT